jgi:pSer/pThr/pTyr-binding forkhead associated (FHA) protein
MSGLRVVVVDGSGAGSAADIGGEGVVIGRESGDLRLDDAELSRRHATIELRGGEAWIVDAGSTNGTFVNGARIHGPVRLATGDVIALGSTRLRIEASGPPVRPITVPDPDSFGPGGRPRVASRRFEPAIATFATVIGTAAALVAYFAAR